MSRPCVTHHRCDCTAERLAALEAENARLRATLAQYADSANWMWDRGDDLIWVGPRAEFTEGPQLARERLAGEPSTERSPHE